MSTSAFGNLQAIAQQIVNDNTAQNNAISAQIGEVKQLLTDYASAIQSGGGPSVADIQTVISQLSSVDSLIQSNTAAVQASGTNITQADPNAAPPTPPPASAGNPVTSTTGVAGTGSTGTTGTTTATS
jgi:4-diphosphocytidyl-2C-methyl-D-erythritol kinase